MCIGTVGINVVIFDAERENVIPIATTDYIYTNWFASASYS
jgi:hypothetical protein